MICAETTQRLDEQLALIEDHIGEMRRILATGLPCDTLLSTLGAIRAILDQVAAAVPSLYGKRYPIRLTPEEFCAEFEQTFKFRIRDSWNLE